MGQIERVRTGIKWRMQVDKMAGGEIVRDDMAKAQAVSDAVPRRADERAFNVTDPDHGPHQ